MKHKCPKCHNEFHQPFICQTCGAEKLYDATVKSLQKHNEQLIDALLMALPFVEDCQGIADYKRGTVEKCVTVIKNALPE